MNNELREDFNHFFKEYKQAWRNNDFEAFSKVLSEQYEAREITPRLEIVDFGYVESCEGWRQAFSSFEANKMEWLLSEATITQLRDNEMMAMFSASYASHGVQSETANLFVQIFERDKKSQDWRLVRSYIEAGVPVANVAFQMES